MPISITFFAGQGDEPTLIKIGTAYESATHHRFAPPEFRARRRAGDAIAQSRALTAAEASARPSPSIEVAMTHPSASYSAVAALLVAAAAPAAAQFAIEEATIAGIHAAIKDGRTTCVGVVDAYIERARAYNGVCTALVTADGADVAPATGYVRAGKPLEFPTQTVAGVDDLSGPRSVRRPAARVRAHGGSGLGPHGHAATGHARRACRTPARSTRSRR